MTRKPDTLKRRYDSKDQIVRDVAFILSAPVADPTKAVVLRRAMWHWTEWDGKHEGCRYWTALARREYLNRKTKRKKLLCHEHVVPQKVVKQMLLSLEAPTEDAVRSIFEKFVIAAVVHREEDALLRKEFRSSMPPEFSDSASPGFQNPWLRYRACGISPIDCKAEPKLFEAFRRPRRRSSNS